MKDNSSTIFERIRAILNDFKQKIEASNRIKKPLTISLPKRK